MIKIGRTFLSFFSLLLFLSLGVCSRASAEVNLSLEIQPQHIGVGDQLQVTLSVQSDSDMDVAEPQFPDVTGLTLLNAQNSGQSTSSRMNIVNGKTDFSKTVSQQFDYLFQATQAGRITIPAIKVQVNGRDYATAPQSLQVLKTAQNDSAQNGRGLGGRGQQGRGGRPLDPFEDDDDMFSQLMKQRQRMVEELQKQMGGTNPFGGGSNPFGGFGAPQGKVPSVQLDVNTKESFFIYLDVDKKEVYEGEQVTANWYIYTRGNLESIDRAKFPDLKGFWKEIIEEVPSLQFSEEIVNGVPFRKALLASHALFPIKAGTAAIDEFKIKGKVRLPTQFGWGQLQEYTRASRRVAIKVLPVPIEGKPQSFSGAVGQFQIQTHVDGLQFPAGQPFTLKVRFEGSGNAKLIELPQINWPTNLEVYDTKSESKFFKDGQSYKEFEILLIPRNEGETSIPKIEFSYFDPKLKQYVTKPTEEIHLKITAATAQSGQNYKSPLSSGSTGIESQTALAPILEMPGAFSWLGYRMPLMLGVLVLIFGLTSTLFAQKYTGLNHGPQIRKIVDAKLAKIENSLKQEKHKDVGVESTNLIYLLLSQMSHQSIGQGDWSQMIQQVPQNYRDRFEEPLQKLFDYFQIVGFAPDEVKKQILSQRPLGDAIAELKKTSHSIADELSKA